MNPDVPVLFWLAVLVGLVLTGSSLVLSAQRAYARRQKNTDLTHLKVYTKRDTVKAPFSNGNRVGRVIFDTLFSCLASVFIFSVNICAIDLVDDKQELMYKIIGSAITFITWTYTLVLAITSLRFPLPNNLGWSLNVHLFVLFIPLFVFSAYSLIETFWTNPAITFTKCIPFILPAFFSLDLLYTTGTVKRGSPFLDENNNPVADILVDSIIGYICFSWMAPLITFISSRSENLCDKDLPRLPSTHRGYNLFYIFSEDRESTLFYRLYHGNRRSIWCQGCLAFGNAIGYYSTAFFLNKLLIFIQDISKDKSHNTSLLIGFGYLFAMACSNIVIYILYTMLWHQAQSNVRTCIKGMLNVEIYRKTLSRLDVTLLSKGNKTLDTENSKDTLDHSSDTDKVKETCVYSNTGTIVNLMSTDSARVSEFSGWWFAIFSLPTELAIGTYFLYTLLGWSCILGLLAITITIPINHFNSKIYVKMQDRLMKARDKRMSLMNEVLQGIRQIKFFAWESNWTKRIMESREAELGYTKILWVTEVLYRFLWDGTPLIVTSISFWSFTKLQGQELTASIAFTSISIFNEMRFALSMIPDTVVQLLQARTSLIRIENYLKEDEIQPSVRLNSVNNANTLPFENESSSMLGFNNATISWPTLGNNRKSSNVLDELPTKLSTAERGVSFVLKDLNITFPKNKLSLICGATGSGKTLLMLSLLGETNTLKGSVFCPRTFSSSTLDTASSITSIKVGQDHPSIVPDNWILEHAVAYVSQTAWLQNASIKDNILFGLPYVHKRYKSTLTACALDKDLSYLDDGDMTEIGEKGITLSGGQKARVALARAVYSRAQNVLMDDVMSAVDAHTAKHLYERCLQGPLMQDRTRILITHHIGLCIQKSAYIVFIKNGQVELSGSPEESKQSNQLSHLFKSDAIKVKDENTDIEEIEIGAREQTGDEQHQKKPKILVGEELRAAGKVKSRLYWFYFKFVGNWFYWVVFVSLIIGCRSIDIYSSWWLKIWAQHYEASNTTTSSITDATMSTLYDLATNLPLGLTIEQLPLGISTEINETDHSSLMSSILVNDKDANHSLNYYLGVYVLISTLNLLTGTLRFVHIFWGGLSASRKLYRILLDRMFRAPLRFFDTTPVGRIVNRVSKDFESIDSSVPKDFVSFCIQWASVITIIFTATMVMPILAIPVILISLANIHFGSRFVIASRELKRMDSVSRSPLFTHFNETILGVATIRAFGMTQHFMLEMIDRVDTNSRPMYYAWCTTRWISSRFSFMGSIIISVTGTVILLNLDHIDAATAGFCLSYIVVFTEMTYWGVKRYTDLEMSFNSVERVVEFLEIDQEAPTVTDVRPPKNWPMEGAIQVDDLHAKYAPDLETVLKGLTFSVKPQEKIGVVGRTGSGKSTLALSFYRFIEAAQGSIVIDGVNIADIGTEDLRSNLTIIPQDPVLFSGTLRSNMDPFDLFSDEEIYTSLYRVHLLKDAEGDTINSNVFRDLETLVIEGGKNFSQGQRQLLCLARALLKRSKIVLMDEATASVDFETDKAIQKTIITEFGDSTVLCIAHRLNTVIEYDRILVLDNGRIVEYASPLDLIYDSSSAFNKMCHNSGEYHNLLELAKAKHELVDISQ